MVNSFTTLSLMYPLVSIRLRSNMRVSVAVL